MTYFSVNSVANQCRKFAAMLAVAALPYLTDLFGLPNEFSQGLLAGTNVDMILAAALCTVLMLSIALRDKGDCFVEVRNTIALGLVPITVLWGYGLAYDLTLNGFEIVATALVATRVSHYFGVLETAELWLNVEIAHHGVRTLRNYEGKLDGTDYKSRYLMQRLRLYKTAAQMQQECPEEADFINGLMLLERETGSQYPIERMVNIELLIDKMKKSR